MLYTHRNGEKAPPTESGWYWFDGRAFLGSWNQHIYKLAKGNHLLRRVTDNKPIDATLVVYADVEPGEPTNIWRGDKAQNVADFSGRWWGPILKPKMRGD